MLTGAPFFPGTLSPCMSSWWRLTVQDSLKKSISPKHWRKEKDLRENSDWLFLNHVRIAEPITLTRASGGYLDRSHVLNAMGVKEGGRAHHQQRHVELGLWQNWQVLYLKEESIWGWQRRAVVYMIARFFTACFFFFSIFYYFRPH